MTSPKAASLTEPNNAPLPLLDKELTAHTKTQEKLNSQTRDLATAQAHLSASKETENELKSSLAKQADDLTRVKATAERTQASLDEANITAAKADDEAKQAKAEAKTNAETAAELRGRVIELEKTAQAIQALRAELDESRSTAAKNLGALEQMQNENESLKLKIEGA
jgi:chromosome segregation ATPase